MQEKTLERIKESHPEVYPNWINFRFPGRGQRETPIADVRGIVEIVMLLPGRHAARVRRQAAELLCKYLGGDLGRDRQARSGNRSPEIIRIAPLQTTGGERSPDIPPNV